MRLLCFVLAVLLPYSAIAGGTHWTVSIENFERTSEQGAVLTLETQSGEGRDAFARCRPLIVAAEYIGESDRKATWSNLVTVEKHREALDFIERRYRAGEHIQFGFIGRGLIASDETGCRVVSRGLLLEGGRIVLSFNYPA